MSPKKHNKSSSSETDSSSDPSSPLTICLINLKEAPHRRAFFESGWLEHVGGKKSENSSETAPVLGRLCGAVPHFHTVDRDPEGGLLGCTRSHMACYKKAVDEGKEMCLVFEDDVRINEHLTEELVQDCLSLIRAGWDVIRLHKTGICKVHGVLSPKFFHSSSFCGRAYFISRSLMVETLKNDSKKIVPYTTFIAKASSRHLTYHLPAIEEGAFGSYNSGGGFGRANSGVALLQWSLNYTTKVETGVANASFYFDLTSPLFTAASFPHATEFWRSYDNDSDSKAKSAPCPYTSTMEYYKLNKGAYVTASTMTQVQSLCSRIVGSIVDFNGYKSISSNSSETFGDLCKDDGLQKRTGLYEVPATPKITKTGTEVVPVERSATNPSAEYDVIVVGSGVAGSSCYYWLNRKFNKKVLLLEQNSLTGSTSASETLPLSEKAHYGSSNGGPRRIGLLELAPGARVRRAWHLWLALQREATEFYGGKNGTPSRLIDTVGEVIVVNIFPLGWILMLAFLLWRLLRVFANLLSDAHCLPDTLKLLFTSEAVQEKLPKCFKGKLNWNNFGVHYEEAAAMRTDNILGYLTGQSSDFSVENKKNPNTNTTGSTIIDSAVVKDITVSEGSTNNSSNKIVTITCSVGGPGVEETKSFTSNYVVLAPGAGTVDLLKLPQFDVSCCNEIDTFVCPVTNIKDDDSSVNSSTGSKAVNKKQRDAKAQEKQNMVTAETLGLRPDEDNACMFAFPGENTYGFPVLPNAGGVKGISQLFVRCNFPERTYYGNGWSKEMSDEEVKKSAVVEDGAATSESSESLKFDTKSSHNAAVVSKFTKNLLGVDSTDVDYHTCRYVRLRIAKTNSDNKTLSTSMSNLSSFSPPSSPSNNMHKTSSISSISSSLSSNSAITTSNSNINSQSHPHLFYPTQAIMDFVPNSSNSVLLLSGLDGYGFKYGSIMGLEVHEVLYGSGQPPPGMEWPGYRQSQENSLLAGMHQVIDKLLKSTGKETVDTSGKTDGAAVVEKKDLPKKIVKDVLSTVTSLLKDPSIAISVGIISIFLVSNRAAWFILILLEVVVHILFFYTCIAYSLGSELVFRPRVADKQSEKEWWHQVAMVWGLHFTWGMGVPILLQYYYTIGIFYRGYSAELDASNATVSPMFRFFLLFLSLCLNVSAAIIRCNSMNEFKKRASLGKEFATAYTRRVKIPGLDQGFLEDKDTVAENNMTKDSTGCSGTSPKGSSESIATTASGSTASDSDYVKTKRDSNGNIVELNSVEVSSSRETSGDDTENVDGSGGPSTTVAKPFSKKDVSAFNKDGPVTAVSVETDSSIVSTGMYSLARHPGFGAHVLQITSLSLWLCATTSFCLFWGQLYYTVGLTFCVAYIIFDLSCKSEEKQMLLNENTNPEKGVEFSDKVATEYRVYRKNVPLRMNLLGLLFSDGSRDYSGAFGTAVGDEDDSTLPIFPATSAFLTGKSGQKGTSLAKTCEAFAKNVRDGNTRQLFLFVCGSLYGQKIEYLDMRDPGDVSLLEKILINSNKGEFIESKIAVPAWDPVRSVESVGPVEAQSLRQKLVCLLDQMDKREETVREAVEYAMAAELDKVIREAHKVKEEHKKGNTSYKPKQVFDCRCLAGATMRTFMWLMSRNEMTEEEVKLAIDATEEWKATIAFKQPPKDESISLKWPYINMIQKHLKESSYFQEVLKLISPNSNKDSNGVGAEQQSFGDSSSKFNFDIYDVAGHLSCMLQPVYISPTINFPDVFAATEVILREYHPEMVKKCRESSDYCDMLLLESIRCQHPFPILERSLDKDIKSDIGSIPYDVSKCPALQVGGKRQIKKGTQVFVEFDQYAKYVSSKNFKDFKPEENWNEYVGMRDRVSLAASTQEWKDLRSRGDCPYMAMPFGSGPRRCAGQTWARKVMKHQMLIIARVFGMKGESFGELPSIESLNNNIGSNVDNTVTSESVVDGQAITTPTKPTNVNGGRSLSQTPILASTGETKNSLRKNTSYSIADMIDPTCPGNTCPPPTNVLKYGHLLPDKPYLEWSMYLQPWVNHRFTGRNNDSKEDDADLMYILGRLGSVIGWFAGERVQKWLGIHKPIG